MDEIKIKRKERILKSDIPKKILKCIKNKDNIIANQEKFKLNDIKNIRRFNELITEIYTDTCLNLVSFLDEGFTTHSTFIKVTNREFLYIKLANIIESIIDGDFTVCIEELTFPKTLSFSKGNKILYLLNYDVGFIEI